MINNLYIKATPAAASITWGSITGTLSAQTDLQSALDAKFDEPTGTVSQYVRGDGSLATFPSLTEYVPYTGATADVDLGTHTLSAKDLVINHSSGSGVAASITKGGAGEALTVNKTSGSGNAMSVTGGVTQLSELHLTTDLADAYIASAATWNGKQDTLVSGTNIKTLEGQSLLGSGNIDLTKSDVGLGNVDNTSDLSKPISTATQTALNAKQNTLTLTTTGTSGASTLVGNTLNIPQYIGGVTSVTGTAPVVSSGGTTPAISMPAATSLVNGYLSSTDWTTFNNKQATLVSATNIKTINSTSLLGSGDIAVQPSLVSGTNIKTINGTSILGSGDLVVGGGGGGGGAHAFIIPSSANWSNPMVNSFISNENFITLITNANRITAYPFIPFNTITSTALVIACVSGVASALGRVAIYSNLNGNPNTRLYQSADLDLSTSGDKTVTTAFTFTAGTTYWLAFHVSTAVTMRAIPSTAMIPVFSNSSQIYSHYYQGWAFGSGAPATFSPNTYNVGNVVNINIKL